MAGQTSRTRIRVTWNTGMVIIRARISMAIRTDEDRVISRGRMAVRALIPFLPVLATINGEILRVVVEVCRLPGCFGVAFIASSWEPDG